MNKIALLILCLSVQNIWSQEWYRDAILKGKEYPRYSEPVDLKIETLVSEIEKNSYITVLMYRSSVKNSDILIALDKKARR